MRKINQGFSLIELMITVSIMGILAAIAVPAYKTYVGKSRTVDLMTASHIGQLMVSEYIQANGITDCSNMPGASGNGVNIPINSNNIATAFIDVGNTMGYGTCTVVIQANAEYIYGFADSLGSMAEIQMASYSNSIISSDSIPYVQLTLQKKGGKPNILFLYSIPNFNSDGSISWTLYSNGNSNAPASLPNISSYSGGTAFKI